ncbi:MAG: EAL domain-containing protein [Nevskia sp.]|nr:EAL domain-containing protein [Nevskia sp.]
MYGELTLSVLERSACMGLWTYDVANRRLWWSAGTFLIHGLPADAAQPDSQQALAYYTSDSRPLLEAAYQEGLNTGKPWDLELFIDGADGRRRKVRAVGGAVYRDGAVVEVAGSLVDVDARQEVQVALGSAPAAGADFISHFGDFAVRRRFADALFAEQELAQVALAAVSDGVVRTDVNGRIVYCNDAAQSLSGLTAARVRGWRFDDVIKLYAEYATPLPSPLQPVLDGGGTVLLPSPAQLSTANGELRPIEGSITPVQDHAGTLIGCIFVFRDVTQTQALARQLLHQSNHDPLTGLPNRGNFESELAERLARARNRTHSCAVLYMDLDRFKLVNDTCGHQEGDRLLQLVTNELSGRLRPGDLLARLGDDEFGLILENCPPERALQRAGALIEAVDRTRFRSGGRSFQIGLSVGVATDSAVEDARQLLVQADTACHVAKRLGGNRAQFYRASDLEVSRTRSDMDWVPRIEQALDENRIGLYAQRIVPLNGGHAPCYEVLVRLNETDGTVVAPNLFLPAAQRFGLMDKIERSVVRQALDKLDRMQRQPVVPDFGYLSINLSGTSVSDPGFTGFLLRELERHRTPPERVRFEITETAALSETEAARDFIASMHRLGYKILLDDFGTGFTSFGYLKSLRANGLKVDQSFTSNLTGDVINQAIVESICKIGSRLGLEIIAEGVEDQVTLEALRSLGVRHAQGWLFHRAEPMERALPPGAPG